MEDGAHHAALRSPELSSLAQGSPRQEEAARLFIQAFDRLDQGQLREAITIWEQALQIYRELDQVSDQRIVLRNMAVVLSQLSNEYSSADQRHQRIEVLESLVEVLRELGDRSGEVSAIRWLGITYREIEDFPRAIEIHQRALALARDMNDATEIARALNDLGLVYRHQRDYPQALSFFEQSLAVALEAQDDQRQLHALGNIANVNRLAGDYEQAVTIYEQALALARATNRGEVVNILMFLSMAYDGLGGLYNDQGNPQQAIDAAQRSLEILEEIDFRGSSIEADAFINLGIAHRNLSNYQEALASFQHVLEIARELDDSRLAGLALGNLCNTYMNLGNAQQAFDLCQESLALSRENNNRPEVNTPQETDNRLAEGRALGNLGGTYAGLGNYEAAIEIFSQRLDIARELQDTQGMVVTLTNLAAIIQQSRGTINLHYYLEALELARDTSNPRLIAMILKVLGDARIRINYVDADPDNAVDSLTFCFSRCVNVQRGYYEEALAMFRLTEDRGSEASTLTSLAHAYLEDNQPEVAEMYLLDAIQILDEVRGALAEDVDRVSIFQTQLNVFSLLQQALIDQGNINAALEVAEWGRSRALVQLLSQRGGEFSDLEAELPTRPDVMAMIRAAQQMNTTLVVYSGIRHVDQDYEWNRLFGGYDIGYGFNHSFYIWVVSPDGTVNFRQQPLTDVNLPDLVTDTRDAIGVRGTRGDVDLVTARPTNLSARRRAESEARLSQLHTLLIEPIADLLPDHPEQTVAFIPQGQLFLVPFPALRDRQGRYLIENHTMVTAPSIQVLQLTHTMAQGKTATPRAERPLIVGNPTMPQVTLLSETGEFRPVRLDSLHGALREAEAVADFLAAAALTGDQATEAQVKQQMPQADIIHLATHGLLEYGDPRQTGTRDIPGAIALAPGAGEDGLLTAAEILEMDLQASLVVLSACDTGRGRLTGDGVIGLSRAFIAAGVPSVVVSLWAVPDAPTADLMAEFYRQLAQGQSKAQALRQTMLMMMDSHPDPRDWAAFTLIGATE